MGKKDQVFKDGATPIHEGDGFQVFRLEDMEPDVLLKMQEHMNTAEFKARLAKNSARPPVRYAVAEDASLPQGADAVVLRDAEGTDDRMIVVSQRTASDRILSIARLALMQDEDTDPDFSGRRTILVWDDMRIAIGDKVRKMDAHLSGDSGHAKALLSGRGEAAHVQGIGKVRTVRSQ